MKVRKYRYFVGDFETTVYKGQEDAEVWASACVELFSEDVKIFHSIREQFDYFISLDSDIICYYHNLKFDGTFWLSYLLVEEGYSQAYTGTTDNINEIRFKPQKEMRNKSISYAISSMGQWYRIAIKVKDHIIELRDSLKLLPFSLRKIGKSFDTKHKKLNMEYSGFRFAGCVITDEEKRYIANDVLVIKEALEIMMEGGNKKLTIGSCCLSEYKKIVGNSFYEKMFPNIYEIPIDKTLYGKENAGEYIRQSYRGGWCYVVKGKEERIFRNGTTADVNSLYPSMMSSESLNMYPVGNPTFWKGDFIPDEALDPTKFFFIRLRTKFYLKKGYLPFIQLKNTLAYKATEMLECSDVYNKEDGKYYDWYYDLEGNRCEANVILTMTMMDYNLFKEHYNLVDTEILDGCYFNSAIGIFDEYIDKYKQIKLTSKGAKRELAKLFLNNLYGKMAANTNSSFKVAFVKPDKTLGFFTVVSDDKIPGYIPVGSAITSYARRFTIKAAQMNYHGVDKPGFIYADTDSIHCDLLPEEMKGIKIDSKNFCCWKLESNWDIAMFTRQKTYIEHIVAEDGEKLDEPYYNVKCAGMPERCKKLFIASLEGKLPEVDTESEEPEPEYTEEEKKFMSVKREITDFKQGLLVPGKLIPKRIRGGVVLVETTYEMR